jgi:hypothetical protein
MKQFLKGSLRTTVAIFLALVGLVIVIASYSAVKDAYAKQQLKPLEQTRTWHSESTKSIGLDAYAKTKFLDGSMMVSAEILGFPEYLSRPANANATLIFEFLDKDGFKIISKPVQRSEFTFNVDGQGNKMGLSYQFKEPLSAERYQQLSRMDVLWTFVTEEPKPVPPVAQVPPEKPMLDHCEPNLSRAERLKRLAQYGTVRETGLDSYTAGWHTLKFLSGTELLRCQ